MPGGALIGGGVEESCAGGARIVVVGSVREVPVVRVTITPTTEITAINCNEVFKCMIFGMFLHIYEIAIEFVLLSFIA
jgi:hypothetical protein